jgi:hypothetical protein
VFAHKVEITKSSGFENFQMKLMSFFDLNNHGREMIRLAWLRILLAMIILVGVSFVICVCT